MKIKLKWREVMGYSKEWSEVLEFVCDFEDKTFMNKVWFRGHSDSSYSLKSGLFREKFDEVASYQIIESLNYLNFSNLGSHLHNNLSGWELLFLMQHHGVKTRLLDWTESFAVALFFACADWKDNNNARIWLFDPTKLNELSIGVSNTTTVDTVGVYEECIYNITILPNNSIAISPPRNNNRITRQRGVFTLQGNNLLSLDEEFNGALIKNNGLAYIDLQPDLRIDAQRYLNHCGIDFFSMYPDLEGLAKHVNHQSGLVNKNRIDWKVLNLNNDDVKKMFFTGKK
jgi:hypothetical protein